MGRRPKFPKKDAEIIGNLTREEATELIFPKGSLDYIITTPKGYVVKAKWGDFTPPKAWNCWQPPKRGAENSRNLDKEIQKIVSNKLVADRLRENNEPCPFYTTRWQIIIAADNAREWTIERGEVERISKDAEEKLNKYSGELVRIRDDILSDGLLGRFRWPDAHLGISGRDQFPDWEERYKNDIREIGGLDCIIAAINRRASFEQTIRGAGSPSCRSILIGELAPIWPWLTGKPAAGSPGGPFSRFVEAAFNCFRLEAPEPGEIRRVIERLQPDEDSDAVSLRAPKPR